MTEYISRGAAVCIADYAVDEHPYDKNPEQPETYSDYNQGWNDACDYIRDRLENTEKADVEPVRHGRWIVSQEHNDIIDMDVTKYTCSVCGQYRLSATMLSQATDYCPNCGAQMDGGANDEK